MQLIQSAPASARSGTSDSVLYVRCVHLEFGFEDVNEACDSCYEIGKHSGACSSTRSTRAHSFVIGRYRPNNLLDALIEGGKLLAASKLRNGFVPYSVYRS